MTQGQLFTDHARALTPPAPVPMRDPPCADGAHGFPRFGDGLRCGCGVLRLVWVPNPEGLHCYAQVRT